MDNLCTIVGALLDEAMPTSTNRPEKLTNIIMHLFENHLIRELPACPECFELNQGHDEDCSNKMAQIHLKPEIYDADTGNYKTGGKK